MSEFSCLQLLLNEPLDQNYNQSQKCWENMEYFLAIFLLSVSSNVGSSYTSMSSTIYLQNIFLPPSFAPYNLKCIKIWPNLIIFHCKNGQF